MNFVYKEVVKAVIKKDNKYLTVLRSKTADVFPNQWDFPGGRLEPSETPEQGIIREVKEETNLDIIPDKIVGQYSIMIRDIPRNFNIFTVKSFTGEIKLTDEHQEYKWLTKKEILELVHEPFIDLYFEENRDRILKTPILYRTIKLATIILFLICTPFVLFLLTNTIKEMYNFPETMYWIIIPLLFISFPLLFLILNYIFYIIPPLRKYFNRIHEKNNLPNFSNSNKGLIKGLLYFSPLSLVILLGLFLSYREYSNNIVGSTVILSTIAIVMLMIKLLSKNISKRK